MTTQKIFPRGYQYEQDPHLPIATTTWSDDLDIVNIFREKEGGTAPFLFGMLPDENGVNRYLAHDDDAAIFTVAGSRAGKGISLILPNLLSYTGAVLVTDVKGENAKISGLYRRDILKQNLVVLDPYHQTDFQSDSFNPLAYFDPKHDEFVDDITDLADALIVRGHSNADPHWDESARAVLKMLLIFIVLEHPPETRNLVALRTLLLKGQSTSQKKNYSPPVFRYNEDETPEENEEIRLDIEYAIDFHKRDHSFTQLLKNFSEHGHHIVAGTAQRLLAAGDRERGSIISSAQRHTDFLDSACIQSVLKTNSFNLNDYRNSSIYLVLPEGRMASQSRWLRLMITLVLRRVQMDGLKTENTKTLLMVLDECAALGYMEVIERAMGYIAGFGVRLHVIFQDLNQAKAIYKERWETFIGNASLFTAFGNSDLTTLKYISERLGKCEVPRIEQSYSGGTSESDNRVSLGQNKDSILAALDGGGSSGETYSKNLRPNQVISPLLLPDEVARFFAKETERVLVLISGEQPIYANRIIYYDDEPFKSLAK